MHLKFPKNRTGSMSLALRLSLLFTALFLLGVLSGVLMAACLNLSSKQTLFSDLSGFIYNSRTESSLLYSLWQISRVPLLILCMSFTCLGVVTIPVSVFVQGYLLSFSVSTMVRFLGWKGCFLGLASFGIRSVVLIPCLLILSVQCFQLSREFLRVMLPSSNGRVRFPRGFILAIVCCMLLLPFGAICDHSLTDNAVSLVLNHFIF